MARIRLEYFLTKWNYNVVKPCATSPGKLGPSFFEQIIERIAHPSNYKDDEDRYNDEDEGER